MAYGRGTGCRHNGDSGHSGRPRPLLRIPALAALGRPAHRIARHGACNVFRYTNRLQPGKRRAGLVRWWPDVSETSFECGERSCVSPADARDTAPIERLSQQGKNPPYCTRLNTPRPPQGGSGAGPCNITRHYAKRPHARSSLVNASASHNAALCVNGPEGVPQTPPGLCVVRLRRVGFDLSKVASRFIRSPARPVSQSKGAPARANPRAVFRPPFACLPPVRPKGLPQSRLFVPPVLPGMARRDSARSRLWQG